MAPKQETQTLHFQGKESFLLILQDRFSCCLSIDFGQQKTPIDTAEAVLNHLEPGTHLHIVPAPYSVRHLLLICAKIVGGFSYIPPWLAVLLQNGDFFSFMNSSAL